MYYIHPFNRQRKHNGQQSREQKHQELQGIHFYLIAHKNLLSLYCAALCDPGEQVYQGIVCQISTSFFRPTKNVSSEQTRLQTTAAISTIKIIPNAFDDPDITAALAIVNAKHTAGADHSKILFLKKRIALTTGYAVGDREVFVQTNMRIPFGLAVLRVGVDHADLRSGSNRVNGVKAVRVCRGLVIGRCLCLYYMCDLKLQALELEHFCFWPSAVDRQ